LIKSDNIADTLSAEELVKILSMRFDQLISYLNNQQTTLEERRKRLDILRMQYKNEVSEYNNEIALLKEQKKYLLEFLNLYRQDKISLDLKAQNLFDDRESIKKDLSTQVEQAQTQMK
jgi:chromosome segregation ATPase